LIAMKKVSGFRGEPQKLQAWVIRIGINQAINYEKREKKKTSLDEIVIDSQVPVIETPLTDLEKRDWEQKIDQALSTLTEDIRSIWLLRHKEGRKYEEIAEITGKPLSTIKSKLDKANKLLRKKLKDLK